MGHTGVIVYVVLCLVVILLEIPSSTEGTDADSGNGKKLYSMHCSILHCIALYCIVLHYIALYSIPLLYITWQE